MYVGWPGELFLLGGAVKVADESRATSGEGKPVEVEVLFLMLLLPMMGETVCELDMEMGRSVGASTVPARGAKGR